MDIEDALECPHCGTCNIRYDSFLECVVCDDCGMTGPHLCDDEEGAVKAWNSLPRRGDATCQKS